MQLPKISEHQPVSAPPVSPAPPARGVQPPQQRRGYLWILAASLAALAVAGVWFRGRGDSPRSAVATSGFRTHTVAAADFERTIRLTGTTAAEKFSAIMTPQLRGSRTGFGRDGSIRTGGGSSGSAGSVRSSVSSSGGGGGSSSMQSSSITGVGSSSSGSGAGGTSASSSSSAAGGSSQQAGGSSAAGTGVQSSRGATALRSATSRSSRPTQSSNRSNRNNMSAASSATMGADGLGSTSSTLPGGANGPGAVGSSGRGGGGGGGGGGGRGPGEFMLVLQEVAKAGSLVKKGEKIAEFDRQYMLTRLDDYKASIIQAEATYKKMVADLGISREAHRQTIAAAKGVLEKAQLDLKTLPVMSAMESERLRLAKEEADAQYKQLLQEVRYVEAGIEADRKVAELDLKQAQLEYRRAEMNANRMELKAPIDGLIVMQSMFRGSEFDQIKQGDQLFPGMMFMQVVDPSSMIINASINQADIELVRIGQRARVRFDAFPGLELPARVTAVAAVAKSGRYRPDWIKEMGVKLKLEKMDPRVIPDLSVSCDVILEKEDKGVVVPREAIFTSDAPAGSSGTPAGRHVFVRDAMGAWQRRDVEVGAMNFISAVVKSGLKPNDVIALERPPVDDRKRS